MLQTLEIYFLLFITYSVLGWCMEVIGKLIELKKFVNRGFLIGPYCTIYGCGALLITILLQKFTFNIAILFITSILVCGGLEYATSYIMEKLFKARWWDYSKRKFNINGRVCLYTIIPFGILGCFIMYISNPFFIDLYNKIPQLYLNIIVIFFGITMLADFCVSCDVVSNLKKTAKLVNSENREDNTEEITKKVREILFGKSAFNRRIFNAYPKLITIKGKIKEKTEEIQKSVNNAKKELKDNITEKAESINKIKRVKNISKNSKKN